MTSDRDRLAADLMIPYVDAPDAADCALCGEPVRTESVREFADRLIALGWRHEPDGDEDWRRLRAIEKAARAVLDRNDSWDDADEWIAVTDALRAALKLP